MGRTFEILGSVTLISLVAFSVSTKGLLVFFDCFTQTPVSALTFSNYMFPALVTLTIATTTIIQFCRRLFFHRHLLKIPKWVDNKIPRGVLLLLTIYTVIWQTNYFFWVAKNQEAFVIMADIICILCSIFIAIILLKPNRTKTEYA